MQKENGMVSRARKPSESVLLGFLLFLGFGTFVFGMSRIYTSINQPFRGPFSQMSNAVDVAVPQQDDKEELKKTDTDGDELSDYDELYVYRTSPYLKDTDSDSYDDRVELSTGQDPNCPRGSVCSGASAPSAYLPTGSATTTTVSGQQVDASNLSPAQIRELLIAQGVPAEKIKDLDDATLTEVFQESIRQLSPQQQAVTSPKPQTPEDLLKLSPAEIRQVLIQTGRVSQEQLKDVDDATLQKVFFESVIEMNGKKQQ